MLQQNVLLYRSSDPLANNRKGKNSSLSNKKQEFVN